MKGKKKKKNQSNQSEFVQVDAYMIPGPQAEMYRVLREAVAEDVLEYLGQRFACSRRVLDNPEEGEAIIGLDADGKELIRIYLNPSNISLAQKARDKDHIDKFVDSFLT